MYKPLDFTKLHIVAKAWAEKVFTSYYEDDINIRPEKVQPTIGGEDGVTGERGINQGTSQEEDFIQQTDDIR